MIPSMTFFSNSLFTTQFPSFLPMPDEYGMDLAPNTASSMAVQMKEIERKQAPYTPNCMDDWSKTNLTVPDDTHYSLFVRII